MRFISRIGVTAALAAALCVTGMAQAAPQQPSAAQIHELLKATGTARLMQSMMQQMSANLFKVMGTQAPCVPQSYWEGFAGPGVVEDVIDKIIPVYQRHFTREDIDGLIKFYRTPLGQKVVREMPAVMHESMQIGETWGRTRMQQMIDKLKQDGTLDAEGKCPAPKSSTSSPSGF